MKTVAIVGVGLIGGSFGLALRKAGFGGRLIGVSSPGAVRDALARGAIDEALPLAQGVAEADLVFLAQPIVRIIETLGAIDEWLRPGTLVTDAGSTKAQVAAQGRRCIRRGRFLGGHPMAGKETRGAAEAEAGLFEGRTWVLTPEAPAELDTAAAREFLKWLEAIGAVVVAMPPAEHDRVVARTSHLPQLLSTALAVTLAGELGSPGHLRVAGPGLADTVRLAGSSYEIWADILSTNREPIEGALAGLIAQLERMLAKLGSDAMAEDFAKANDFAARLREARGR
jgi:prephenate dehydrogenase